MTLKRLPYTADGISRRIDQYFKSAGAGKPAVKKTTKAATATKLPDSNTGPPTLTGLALFLGIESLQAYEEYERKGKFSQALKRGRLRIEAEYEKKLHHPSAYGAIFALKALGWSEKAESNTQTGIPKELKVIIIETGPRLAATEKEVIL